MGFKLLRPPRTNICVKTDYSTVNSSPSGATSPGDEFEAEDLIKNPKISPTCYSKDHSFNINLKQGQDRLDNSRRHSIITLLQPPSTAGGRPTRKIQFYTNENRTCSENALLKISSTSTSSSSCQNSSKEKSHPFTTGTSSRESISVSPCTESHQEQPAKQSCMKSQTNQSGGLLIFQKDQKKAAGVKEQMPTSSESNILKRSKIPVKITSGTVSSSHSTSSSNTTNISGEKTRLLNMKKSVPSSGTTKCFRRKDSKEDKVESLEKTEQHQQPGYNIFGSLKNIRSFINPKNETKKSNKTRHEQLKQQQSPIVPVSTTNSANSKVKMHYLSYSSSSPLNHLSISTTPDNTKLLVISNPSITITSDECEVELSTDTNISGPPSEIGGDEVETRRKSTDLNQILGNFKKATSSTKATQQAWVRGQCENLVTEFGIVDTSRCVDFGIYDYLSENHSKNIHYSSGDEVEIDMSSDTDNSFLDATPPHRFSDSDMELLIEPLAITLDTTLFNHQQQQWTPTSGENSNASLQSTIGTEITTASTTIGNKTPPIRIIESTRNINSLTSLHDGEYESFAPLISRAKSNRFVHVKKPLLRRNISLPASTFKLRLIGFGKTVSSYDTNLTARTFYDSHSRLLSRVDSTSLTELEKLQQGNSLESNSSTISNLSLFLLSSGRTSTNNPSSYSGESNSIITGLNGPHHEEEFEEVNEENEVVFATEIEKKALLLRNAKRMLTRQDTMGNFAPPDFCNT